MKYFLSLSWFLHLLLYTPFNLVYSSNSFFYASNERLKVCNEALLSIFHTACCPLSINLWTSKNVIIVHRFIPKNYVSCANIFAIVQTLSILIMKLSLWQNYVRTPNGQWWMGLHHFYTLWIIKSDIALSIATSV